MKNFVKFEGLNFILASSFLIIFITISPKVFAMNKNWKIFHSNNNVKMFYKTNSIKGTGIKTVQVMLDFVKNQISSDGKEIRSVRMVQNYDCAGSRVRLKSAINYSDSLLKGAEVARGNEVTPWQSIPSGTPYFKLLNLVCK
jgi:hypothetical protein